jgi:lipopolysaccharide export system protein LptA
MRRMTIALTAGVLAVGAVTTAGWAQISSSGEPFMVSADDLELVQADGVQIWRGRAEAVQGENRLRAGEIRVHHQIDNGGFGAAERIEALGEVFFVTPEQVARGDRAVYSASTDTLLVTGDVILRQGENVLTGSSLSINIGTGRARMEGAPTGNAGRRVQGVFYPDRD